MSKLIIGHDNFIDDSGTTLAHSTEVANFEAEKVQVWQLAERFRTTVDNPASIRWDFGLPRAWDLAAVIGTNATKWRNLLLQANDFDTTWTLTNATLAQNADDPEATDLGWTLTDDATSGLHCVNQSVDLPSFSTEAMSLCFSCHFHRAGAGSYYIGFRMGSTNLAAFGIDSGEQGSNTWVNSSEVDYYGIDNIPGTNWWRAWCVFSVPTAGGATTFSICQVSPADGVTFSYSGGANDVEIFGAQLEVDPNTFADGSEKWDEQRPSELYKTGAVQGSLIRYFCGTADNSDDSSTNWLNHCLAGDQSDRDTILHYFYDKAESGIEGRLTHDRYGAVQIYDPDNADSYVEIGRLFVGKAWASTYGIGAQMVVTHEEVGGEIEARGGQIYRPVHKRRRLLSVSVRYEGKINAIKEVSEIARACGRSKPVLFAILPQRVSDGDSGWDGQVGLPVASDLAVYGFLDAMPVVRYTGHYSQSAGSPLYDVQFTVREVTA